MFSHYLLAVVVLYLLGLKEQFTGVPDLEASLIYLLFGIHVYKSSILDESGHCMVGLVTLHAPLLMLCGRDKLWLVTLLTCQFSELQQQCRRYSLAPQQNLDRVLFPLARCSVFLRFYFYVLLVLQDWFPPFYAQMLWMMLQSAVAVLVFVTRRAWNNFA